MDRGFAPATTADIVRWSSGCIESKSDLYSPAIFGPEMPMSCPCGAARGCHLLGQLCECCAEPVAGDPRPLRDSRLGHAVLPAGCRHPLFPHVEISAFPIAPIAYRIVDNGALSELGQRFERLVALTLNTRRYQGSGSRRQIEEWNRGVRVAVAVCLLDVLGPSDTPNVPAPGGLLHLALRAATHGAANAASLMRACGIARPEPPPAAENGVALAAGLAV